MSDQTTPENEAPMEPTTPTEENAAPEAPASAQSEVETVSTDSEVAEPEAAAPVATQESSATAEEPVADTPAATDEAPAAEEPAAEEPAVAPVEAELTESAPEAAAPADESGAPEAPTGEPAASAVEEAAAPAAAPVPVPKPGPGAIPTPKALSKIVHAPAPAAAPAPAHSESAKHGRVAEDGTVYVTEGDGERAVGSYPGATPDEALQYFARKYDELYGQVDLLHQRLDSGSVAAKEATDNLAALREHTTEPACVGDLAALSDKVASIEGLIATRREAETAERAEARAKSATEREAIVAEAEKIAAVPVAKVQWKQSTERMRALLDEWKTHQRSAAKLDKPTENALWQRFSHARNGFDKARRAHFAQLDETRAGAKAAKEDLVAQAEALSTSTDWTPTARAFKQLMDQWRQAGRAARSDDDALWERFRTAQDTFFNAKDEVAAAEDESYRANLEVKEALMVEAEAILPVKDLDAAKAALRVIQEKWDKAGKVPRADIDRTEKALRRVENAVRDAEEKKWKTSNPELAARANSLATQLEASVAALREDLAKAEASGNERKAKDARAKLEAQEAWLAQAKAGLEEHGG